MTNLQMPSPPRRHYWKVSRHLDEIWVDLRRESLFTGVDTYICGYRAKWLRDEHANAREAIRLAEEILADRNKPVTNGLNGLQGYTWGGIL